MRGIFLPYLILLVFFIFVWKLKGFKVAAILSLVGVSVGLAYAFAGNTWGVAGSLAVVVIQAVLYYAFKWYQKNAKTNS
ncbi:hypothetical protein [Pleionea sp. CnH1-48]|uniref:hypothetical protein n=1 Tax=Pleionea sp. CnH1-48 TaxID=2954494 RepID=UPI0020968CD4|nr:hypothetical protein [Pleionea sp. CnH1-48]MCO7227571.1 hypothetical protein [Pleionea sp. CnH1-48]